MKSFKKIDVLLLATKSIKKNTDPSNSKEYCNSYSKRKKYEIAETIKNNYSATKSYRKTKHFLHKIGYYRTSKDFT